MTMESGAPAANRPYGPPSNVANVLHRLRSRNLPERIDAEYLRDAGIPEGLVGRTLFALRFLGLVGEAGEHSQALRSIHTSTDEEYRAILSGLVRQAYKEVFDVLDPADDGQDRILNVFRRYTPASQRERMVIFFLGICREAGIPTLDAPRQRGMNVPRAASGAPRSATRTPSAPREKKATKAAGNSEAIAPALEGLIRSLPTPGTLLGEARRRQWLEMAKATLTFLYPSEEAAAIEDDNVELAR